ncbi:MAG: hypothetical protein IJY96_04290 [Oscillospiraceae bacterium]|nr:hypothetical protein [Oscillospiraceae bacterium]
MAVKKTSYIDAEGNKQTGYIIDGTTYTDEAGTKPVGKGSIVDAGGQQWIKGVGEGGASMLYSDYLKQQGMTATDYIDPTGQNRTGYIKNGVTYADVLGENKVGVGSVVTVNGQQIYKGENGNLLYSDYIKQTTPQKTTYTDATGATQTGYIIGGKTYKDEEGTQRIDNGSIVDAGGQKWVMTDNGGISYEEYMANKVPEQNPVDYSSIDDAGILNEMMNTTKTAYEQALLNNDQQAAAQLQQNMNDIARRINELNAGYQEANKQLYRDYMMSRKNMPQLLAAQGITGGLSESTLLGLETGYQNNLVTNERERLAGVQSIEEGGADRALEIAIAKAKADAAAGDTNAERRLAALTAMLNQRNLDREYEAGEEAENYSKAFERAQTLAAAGDFSGYKALGYTDAEIAAMKSAWDKEQGEADFETQLEKAMLKAEYGDSSDLYALLGLGTGDTETGAGEPVYGTINNGSLTPEQVAEMQKYYGLTADGQWGPNSMAVAGSADDAWAKYQANKGKNPGEGIVELNGPAQHVLRLLQAAGDDPAAKLEALERLEKYQKMLPAEQYDYLLKQFGY